MEEPIKLEIINPDNKYFVVGCTHCECGTRHKVLTEADGHWQDERGIVDWWAQYQVIQCQGCLTISFCESSRFSEDWDHDPDTGEAFCPTKRVLYPDRASGKPPLDESHYLPSQVQSIYQETYDSLHTGKTIMAGFGIRAIVEAVCKDKSANGGNLQKKIDSLFDEGHITKEGSTILHNLRFMGNAAAHEMKSHTSIELEAAMEVVEYLLRGVYIIPRKADRLPKKS
jgi:hypothetical protein